MERNIQLPLKDVSPPLKVLGLGLCPPLPPPLKVLGLGLCPPLPSPSLAIFFSGKNTGNELQLLHIAPSAAGSGIGKAVADDVVSCQTNVIQCVGITPLQVHRGGAHYKYKEVEPTTSTQKWSPLQVHRSGAHYKYKEVEPTTSTRRQSKARMQIQQVNKSRKWTQELGT